MARGRCNIAATLAYLIVIIGTPLLSGCGGQGSKHPNGWFSIGQPSGWMAPELMAESTDVFWQNVARMGYKNEGAIVGGVVVGRFAGGAERASMDELADKFAAQYQGDRRSTIHKRAPTTIGGKPAIRFDMEYPLDGSMVSGIYYYVRVGNDYYSVDFFCRPEVQGVFEEAHYAVIKSLQFH